MGNIAIYNVFLRNYATEQCFEGQPRALPSSLYTSLVIPRLQRR